MSFPRKKTVQYISKYDKHKKICEVKKAHSPNTILFCTNDLPDEWLIDVIEYKTVSGVISEDYGITSARLDDYLKFIGNSGWVNITKF